MGQDMVDDVAAYQISGAAPASVMDWLPLTAEAGQTLRLDIWTGRGRQGAATIARYRRGWRVRPARHRAQHYAYQYKRTGHHRAAGRLYRPDRWVSRVWPNRGHEMQPGITPRRFPTWLMVAAIAAGTFITALDQTVVVTALPAVMADLKIPIFRLETVIWIVTAYLLGYTVAMPLLGRMADVYGYRLVYHVSLVIFSIGTTLVALSGQWDWLNGVMDPLHQIVTARVIQAIGGGGTVPISLAIAAALVTPRQRGLALGIVAGAAEAGSMLGPAYGGAVIEFWGWRAIFWLNIPQAAVIGAALLFLSERRIEGSRMDYRGAVALSVALALLSLAVAHEGLFRLSSLIPWWLLGGSALSVGALVVLHRRTAQPLLTSALFRAAAFLTANIAQLLVGIALIIAMATTVIMANTVMDIPSRPGGCSYRCAVAAANDGDHTDLLRAGRVPVTLGGRALGHLTGLGIDCGGNVPPERVAHRDCGTATDRRHGGGRNWFRPGHCALNAPGHRSGAGGLSGRLRVDDRGGADAGHDVGLGGAVGLGRQRDAAHSD